MIRRICSTLVCLSIESILFIVISSDLNILYKKDDTTSPKVINAINTNTIFSFFIIAPKYLQVIYACLNF